MTRRIAPREICPWGVLAVALAATLFMLQPAAASPVPSTTGSQTGLIIAGILLLIFGAVGAYMVYSGIKSRANARASETWPISGGTVLAAEVEKRPIYHRKTRTTTYSYEPIIRYSYKVAGTGYECSTIRFGDLVRNSEQLAQQLLAKYPAGSTVEVRYNPADPACATLETLSAGGKQILMGAVFIAIPLFILVVTAFSFGVWQGGPSLPPEIADQLNKPN